MFLFVYKASKHDDWRDPSKIVSHLWS